MIKEQDCTNYEPGIVTILTINDLNSLLLRDGRKAKLINGLWLGGKGDNQARTEFYYLYMKDNLLNGI